MPAPGDLNPRVVRTRNDVLGAAIRVFVDEGWDALTHPHVAAVAGYSKATLYAHWPTRFDLVRDAFVHFGAMPHHVPTGDLRADLLGELRSFRAAMVDHRLDRAMTMVVELATAVPELADVRERFVVDGERVMRTILEPHLSGAALEAATVMVCGAVVHTSLLHARPIDDDVLEAVVDLALGGIGAPDGPAATTTTTTCP
ncbi:TetR/AcrR family transcriptional regulator [Nocardioides rubriscoriae]|uniref:TetR/AcrR family transcriptional regulator n=1 Tax=Nocardioides rubriscoriae TaxID=642762 RepID=UPI0011DF244B|nr:TetR/AcrR family transcriptional regulator [Nocardioides rubriscoriae]